MEKSFSVHAFDNFLLQNMVMPNCLFIHPRAFREIQWILNRPLLRTIYRELGYPFGRNQGSFKRWALTVGQTIKDAEPEEE